MEMEIITEKPSEIKVIERLEILAGIQAEEPSPNLRSFLEQLASGSREISVEKFIEGASRLVNISGHERSRYYYNPVKGLHYPSTFTAAWNERYPRHPISLWDQDFRLQAPPDWSNEIVNGLQELKYQGSAPISEALNHLLIGPTTLDCGMATQVTIWIGKRYVLGDTSFNEHYKFAPGQFVLSPNWDGDENEDGRPSNLLFPFYDEILDSDLQPDKSIGTVTIFNHPTYLAKHPAGTARLFNAVTAHGKFLTFDPLAKKNVLTETEIANHLLVRYNAPRDYADHERLHLWRLLPPGTLLRDLDSNVGGLLDVASHYENHTLTDEEWKRAEPDHAMIFNYGRFVSCLDDSRLGRLREGETVLDRAAADQHELRRAAALIAAMADLGFTETTNLPLESKKKVLDLVRQKLQSERREERRRT